MNKNKKTISIVSYIVGIVLLLFLTSLLLDMSKEEVTKLKYYEVLEMFENDQIESYTLDLGTGALEAQVKDQKEKLIYTVPNVSVFLDDVDRILEAKGESAAALKPDYLPIKQTPWWVSMLPTLLLIGAMVVFWFFMMRQNGGAGSAMTFGKANYRTGKNEKPTTFADVAGCKEEKEELEEIVDFLKHPNQFNALGARIPKGVLLVGQPGTGKTLLARAVAGEAGVPFFSISGSDFVEMFVGVGASRVRDLFGEAKKNAPSIVFIDEIDAVGRHRGAGLGGGHDEREQTLNQLLVEMDGFGNNEGVIVMAATNRADILDNALLRPGRFDRQVYVGMPDIKGREAILKIHARGKPLADDVDLKSIAKGTPGFSGADLENLMNEAALLAVRRKHRFITMEDCDEAILKVEMGPEKKSRKMSDKAKRLTAYHESGHAIASKFLQHTDPVHYITIIPRGMAGGFTLYRPDEDAEDFTSRAQMFERIVSCLGGRIAEKLFLDDISTGASGDIQQATSIARNMVTRYGMSEKLGPIQYDSSDHSIFIGRDFGTTKSYSEETAALIDEEVKRIFDEAAALCEKILTEHRDTLIGVAEYLLENESMDRETFDYYCLHGTFPEPKPAPAMQDDTIERPARKIARFDDPPAEDASAGMADEPDDKKDE